MASPGHEEATSAEPSPEKRGGAERADAVDLWWSNPLSYLASKVMPMPHAGFRPSTRDVMQLVDGGRHASLDGRWFKVAGYAAARRF